MNRLNVEKKNFMPLIQFISKVQYNLFQIKKKGFYLFIEFNSIDLTTTPN